MKYCSKSYNIDRQTDRVIAVLVCYLFDCMAWRGLKSQKGTPSRNMPSRVCGKQWAKTAVLSLQSTSMPVLQWYGETILY